MGYRYCPGCGEWLETAEYTVDEQGETVCPDHKAVHGFLFPGDDPAEIPDWYDDRGEMIAAARRQGLIDSRR